MSDAFSAIIIVGALVLPEGTHLRRGSRSGQPDRRAHGLHGGVCAAHVHWLPDRRVR